VPTVSPDMSMTRQAPAPRSRDGRGRGNVERAGGPHPISLARSYVRFASFGGAFCFDGSERADDHGGKEADCGSSGEARSPAIIVAGFSAYSRWRTKVIVSVKWRSFTARCAT
jgi:hypothetical protein